MRLLCAPKGRSGGGALFGVVEDLEGSECFVLRKIRFWLAAVWVPGVQQANGYSMGGGELIKALICRYV